MYLVDGGQLAPGVARRLPAKNRDGRAVEAAPRAEDGAEPQRACRAKIMSASAEFEPLTPDPIDPGGSLVPATASKAPPPPVLSPASAEQLLSLAPDSTAAHSGPPPAPAAPASAPPRPKSPAAASPAPAPSAAAQ